MSSRYDWQIEELRSRLDRGEPVDRNSLRALLDKVDAIVANATLPAEFVVRVGRVSPTLWRADHPLFEFSTVAHHPADCLKLASRELRRVLSTYGLDADNDDNS